MKTIKQKIIISNVIVIAMILSLVTVSPINDDLNVHAASISEPMNEDVSKTLSEISTDAAITSTFEELEAAVGDSDIETIIVDQNIEFEKVLLISRDLKIKGTNNQILSVPQKCGFLHFSVEDGINFYMNNLTIKGPGRDRGLKDANNGGIVSGNNCKMYYENMTITDCHNTRGDSPNGAWIHEGGALIKKGMDTKLYLKNCIISDNTSDWRGGAISCDDIIMENCIIKNNLSDRSSGAIFCGASSTPQKRYLKNCIAYNNKSNNGSGGVLDAIGIGIYNCTMYDNEAGGRAGALSLASSTSFGSIIVNSTIVNNKCGSHGGGISEATEIINCIISGNECGEEFNSGGVSLGDKTPIIRGSVITGNYSKGKNVNVDIDTFTDSDFEFQDGDEARNIVSYKGKLSDLIFTKTVSGREYPLLSDNGGFSPTVMPAVYSPMINAIPMSEYETWFDEGNMPTTDQRGEPRPDPGNPDYVDYGPIDIFIKAPTKVEFTSSNPSRIHVGNIASLTVKYSPSNTTYPFSIWSSSNSQVLAVDKNGRITGRKEGKAVITAKHITNQNIYAKHEVTVMKQVSKISSPFKTLYLKKKTNYTPNLVMYNKNAVTSAKIIWKSSNKKVAKVNSKGKITTLKTGKAKITGTTYSGKEIVFNVKVVKNKKVLTSFKVSGVKNKLKKGKTAQLKIKLKPSKATNVKVTFKSSKSKVLSVDKSGKLTAKKKGTAKITIKTGGKKKVLTVKVI